MIILNKLREGALSASEAASTCVLAKWCFEDMQQIYRRTPMPKCDFNNVASNIIEITL